MKSEDFEELRAFCEKKGFEIESYCGGKTAIIGVKDRFTIKDLAYGKCALRHDGTVNELNEVLSNAFPKYQEVAGTFQFYFKHPMNPLYSDFSDSTELPTQSTKVFLEGLRAKKDIWDGVEFVRVRDGYVNPDYIAGKIYPIKGRDEKGYFETLFDEDGDDWNGLEEDEITPSTESAYIEQLKNECFDRFGEINGEDVFKAEWVQYNFIVPSGIDSWKYVKESDRLYFNGVPIYQQGKWATRVKERIRVEYDHYSLPFHPKFILAVHFEIDDPNRMNDEIGKFLAQKLEEYLNK